MLILMQTDRRLILRGLLLSEVAASRRGEQCRGSNESPLIEPVDHRYCFYHHYSQSPSIQSFQGVWHPKVFIFF